MCSVFTRASFLLWREAPGFKTPRDSMKFKGCLSVCASLIPRTVSMVPYNWKFHWCNILWKYIQWNFRATWRFDHTPISWWPYPTCEPKNRHWAMKQIRRLVQEWPTLPFVWRPSQLRKYQDCGQEIGLLNCWSVSILTTLERLFRVCWHFYKVGGWFFSTATI